MADSTTTLAGTLEAAKAKALDEALTLTQGHRARAAGILGVCVKTVHNLLQRYPDVAKKHPVPRYVMVPAPAGDQADNTSAPVASA